MATDVWALVRGDNEKALEDYLERCEHDIKKLEEVAQLLDRAINESKRRCGEIEKAILLEEDQLKIEELARELSVQRHIHALTITRNTKYFNRKFPSPNSGQSLRSEYFTQKRIREAERRELIQNHCEDPSIDLPRPELLGRLNSVQPTASESEKRRNLKRDQLGGSLETTMTDPYPSTGSSKIKSKLAHQDDLVDLSPRPPSMGYHEFRQDRQSEELVHSVTMGAYREQRVDSLGYEEMAQVELHVEGDSRGVTREQIAHIHTVSSQGNQKSNERVPPSSTHHSQLIGHQEDHHQPEELKHSKSFLSKTSSAFNKALTNLHIKKKPRTGSSGSESSRGNTQEIHVVSQAIADPRDPDNIENRLHQYGVPHMDITRVERLTRSHEMDEIPAPISHYDPYSDQSQQLIHTQELGETPLDLHSSFADSDASTVILNTEHNQEIHQEENISATVHVHRESEHIHTQISQSIEQIHGVELKKISPPPRAPITLRTPPPIPPKTYGHYDPYKDDDMYEEYVRKAPPIMPKKVPPTPIGSGESSNPYTIQSDVDREVMEASNRGMGSFSPEPVIDEAGYAIPERVLSPPPEPINEKKWTWKSTNTSSRSRTPTDYEVANLMAETARLDHIHEYQPSQEIPHMIDPENALKSPIQMERVLSPVLSREHVELTKMHYDDGLEAQLRATILYAEKSLTETEKKPFAQTSTYKERGVDTGAHYTSVTQSPIKNSVHPLETTTSTTSSITSTDIIQEVESRRNFRLDGITTRTTLPPNTATPPSTPMTSISSVPSHLVGYYLKSNESHLSAHLEHEYHEVAGNETHKKVSPIYDEVARDSSVHSSSHSPVIPIAATRSPTNIHSPATPMSATRSPTLYEYVDGKREAQLWKHSGTNQKKEITVKNHEYDEVARDEKKDQQTTKGISQEIIKSDSELHKGKETFYKQHHQHQEYQLQNTGTYTSTVETSFGDENVYEEIDQYQIKALPRAPPPVPQSAVPQRTAQVAREAFAHKQDSSEDKKYEGNRYHDESHLGDMGENEELDWELIYTTNAIRQMSRNNKWRESILNKDRIPKPPKKQQKEIPDVLPKNSPFVSKTVEPPRSKTPTSWTKNEGFTFSVPGIKRIDSEEKDDQTADLKEKWGKILNEEPKHEVWKDERVEKKHVPPHVYNKGTTGSQIRVPSVPPPVRHPQPEPVVSQKPQSLPPVQSPTIPSQRPPSTPDIHYYQGFVKDIRQMFSHPESVKWERSQSVGNIYETPRSNARLNQPKRETQPVAVEKTVVLDRPISSPNLTKLETPRSFVKQSTSSHIDTPARISGTFSTTSTARLSSPRRLESPRPRPVDLSSLRADPEYRVYSLRTPSPSTPKRTPSPTYREYAEVQLHVEESSSKKEDEKIYNEVRESSPVKPFYSPTWQRIEQEVARYNAQYANETTSNHDVVHQTQETHLHHHQSHQPQHQHHQHQHVHHHAETKIDFERQSNHVGHKHLNGHHKMSDEERFVIIGEPKTPLSPKPRPVDLREKEAEPRPSPQPRRKTREILVQEEEKEPEFLQTQREILKRRAENQRKFEDLLKEQEERRRVAKEREELEERQTEEERFRVEIERRERMQREEEEKKATREREEKQRLKREEEDRKKRDEERRRKDQEEAEREHKRREAEMRERAEVERKKEEEHRRWEEEKRHREIEERRTREREKRVVHTVSTPSPHTVYHSTYKDAEKSRMEPIYDTVYESPGLSRPQVFEHPAYETVYEPRKTTPSKLEAPKAEKSPANKKLTPTPTEGGKWQLERYEDEDVEKRTIPVYRGHVLHDGREMTVFPLASAHHFDQVHYELGENQRPPGIPEHIDLTNAEEVMVETKTKVVTTVKRRAPTGELFEENYLSETGGFPRSVHMDSPVQRLYGDQTLDHPHLESPLSRRSPRGEIGTGASPIYDTVHSSPADHQRYLGSGEDRTPLVPTTPPPARPPQPLETQRTQPEYRSIGTGASPTEKFSPDSPVEGEGYYFDRNGELRRSWTVKTYEGNQLELGSHKYKLRKMPDLDSGLGSGERPSPERNAEETPALRDWDPRLMLDALYELSYEPRVETKRDRFVNMEGHVEVPSDETATVAELERNWKEQYMKTKDGRLQVFVTHYAGEAPTQDVSLHGVEVDANREDRTLLVHGGKERVKVLLRIKKCDTAETFDKWRQALLSHAAASRLDQYVEPVQRALHHISKRIVILELGSTSIRAGLLHQKPKLPQVFFPAMGCVLESGKIIVGNEAYEPHNRQQGELVRPIQCDPSIERYTVDRAVTRACIERVIRDLGVDPSSHHVLLSLPQNIPSSIIGELLQTLLAELGFRAAGITRQPSLILYLYDVTTGVVVDIGDRLNIVPVIDGYMVESAVVSIPMGAQQIRDSLRTSLASHNKGLFSFQTPCERLILRYVMEHSTYVPSDYEEESRSGGDRKSISLAPFRPTPSMPTQFEIDDSRFTCTEGLFRPKKWALESKGIHQLIHDSVTQSPIDSRRTLYKNIYLGGGASLLPGLAEKLETELAAIVPSTIHAQVHISPWRYHAAFLGAQVFASGASFEDQCIGVNQLSKFLNQLQASGF